MLRLNTGFSRKIGEPNYSSRGASIHLELELESHLIRDGDALTGRIRQLFDLARQAVDEELGLESTPRRHSVPHTSHTAPHGDMDTGTNRPAAARDNNNGRRAPRPATSSQLRAIRSICRRLQLDPERLAANRFDVEELEALTVPEASELIDELKAVPTGAR